MRRPLKSIQDTLKAHNNLGITLQFFGKIDLAVQSYKNAISIKPDFLDAQINLGVILTELGKLSEAKSSLRKALSIDSNSALAHNSLGNVLKGSRQL
jgi:tetratricopeptide (TPR) repeat protein